MDDAWPIDPRPSDLPDDLREVIKPELEPDERLIWASRADLAGSHGHRGGHATAGIWAGSFLAGGFVMIVLSVVPDPRLRPAEAAMAGFGTIFGIVGLLVAIGTLASLASTRKARRLLGRRVYALTDRRAIIWAPVAGSDAVTIHVYPRGSIKPGQIERTQFPDGSGTLKIEGGYSFYGRFEGIADVRRVEALVRRFLVAPEPDPSP